MVSETSQAFDSGLTKFEVMPGGGFAAGVTARRARSNPILLLPLASYVGLLVVRSTPGYIGSDGISSTAEGEVGESIIIHLSRRVQGRLRRKRDAFLESPFCT
jgi:hypothetical protein